MGRPKLASDAKRRIPLAAKFTGPEVARLQADLERLQLPSMSDLFRQRVLTGRVVVRKSAELCAADRIALTRVGTNLNQIAKHLNEHAGDLQSVARVSSDLQATLSELNAMLLRVRHGP